MTATIARAPLSQYRYLVDVWRGGVGSLSTSYGFQEIADARRFASKYPNWEIREWNAERQAFALHSESTT